MNALEIKGLTKKYKNFSISNLNLTVPSGSIVGLIGENGAGKSTTFKLILDMIEKDNGSITLLGKDHKDGLHLIKEDIGVVLDEIGIPESFSTKEINKIMQYTYKRWNSKLFQHYLEKMKIPQNKIFKQFSRGMKMKLSIAIALSHQAKLLLLDEPTSGLDPVIRDEIVNIFYDFTRDETHSILISSHIVSDLEKLCDYIAFLHNGSIILFEEKDILREQFGIIQCNKDELKQINESAIKGKKQLTYGFELLVKREQVSKHFQILPVDIEQLFLFMVKGG